MDTHHTGQCGKALQLKLSLHRCCAELIPRLDWSHVQVCFIWIHVGINGPQSLLHRLHLAFPVDPIVQTRWTWIPTRI